MRMYDVRNVQHNGTISNISQGPSGQKFM